MWRQLQRSRRQNPAALSPCVEYTHTHTLTHPGTRSAGGPRRGRKDKLLPVTTAPPSCHPLWEFEVAMSHCVSPLKIVWASFFMFVYIYIFFINSICSPFAAYFLPVFSLVHWRTTCNRILLLWRKERYYQEKFSVNFRIITLVLFLKVVAVS